MYETMYSDGGELSSEFQAKQLFQQDYVLQITMDLYDVNLETIENWKNRVSDDLVWDGAGFDGEDDVISPTSLSEQRTGVVSKTLQCDRELHADSPRIPQILATHATHHCFHASFL